ncbi:winged helix-turn-helix transcriptional regulator [Halobellus sp. EA9]|uniref:Lrp/AsnC family transcriptional regulator n=1 Tax=Halobellus sp. EA9 TaxID=3421647 RepID=UPI003EBB4A20
MVYGLDDVDRAILYFLSEDARHNSATDIAEHVRVSAQTVRNRIQQLEDEGVIEGYYTQIDFEKADGLLRNLYMCTTATEDRAQKARQALQIPGVITVQEVMTGHNDLRITAIGAGTTEISQIGRAITDLGIDIEEEDLIRRVHISPYHQYSLDTVSLGAEISDFLSLTGDAEIIELTVADGAPITGTTLEDAKASGLLNDESLVITIERDETVLTPRGHMEIFAGDVVTILNRQGIDQSLQRVFASAE